MKDGGSAFPQIYPRSDEDGRGGMSLRDWFAGQALAAVLTAEGSRGCVEWNRDINAEEAAKFSYWAADAMLKAREVEQPK